MHASSETRSGRREDGDGGEGTGSTGSRSAAVVVVDNKIGGQAVYQPGYWSRSQADELQKELDGLPEEWWTPEIIRGQASKRLVCAFADVDGRTYSYVGQPRKAKSWKGPETPVLRLRMEELREKVDPRLNFVLLNWYNEDHLS